MSTGLTYLTITDFAVGSSPGVAGTFVFSSYEEAYNYGDWYLRNLQAIAGGSLEITVDIYTTSPNSNGRWSGFVVPPAFTSFD